MFTHLYKNQLLLIKYLSGKGNTLLAEKRNLFPKTNTIDLNSEQEKLKCIYLRKLSKQRKKFVYDEMN